MKIPQCFMCSDPMFSDPTNDHPQVIARLGVSTAILNRDWQFFEGSTLLVFQDHLTLDDPRPRYAMTFVQEGCRTTKTTMLHEIFHALGAVDSCATYHFKGHVRDYQSDLMFSATAPLETRTLDIGRDDYFGHSIPGCMDLANSPFLVAS